MASAGAPTMNGDGTSVDIRWTEEHEEVLKRIAETDAIDPDWNLLKNAIKHKLEQNINAYLDNLPSEDATRSAPNPQSQSSPPGQNAVSNRSSPIIGPSPVSVTLGLIIPPFPPRKSVATTVCETQPGRLTRSEADKMIGPIHAILDEFESPPFTIQRVCELLLDPQHHYRSAGKYLRALERSLLVTSPRKLFPTLSPSEEEYAVNPASASSNSLREATTPLFSPIPFLHDDARSRSPSPVSILPSHSTSWVPAPAASSLEGPALGLVDELDNPQPGHLSERPTPLTAVTTPTLRPAPAPLSERFVKAEERPTEADWHMKDLATAEPGTSASQEEDKEVESMVLEPSQ